MLADVILSDELTEAVAKIHFARDTKVNSDMRSEDGPR